MKAEKYSDELSNKIEETFNIYLRDNPDIVRNILKSSGLIEDNEIKHELTTWQSILHYMQWYIIEVIKLFGILTLVVFSWQQLELYMLGEIKPNEIDGLVALILSASIYWNIKKSHERKDNNIGGM